MWLAITLVTATLLRVTSITGLSIHSSVTTWDDGPKTRDFNVSLQARKGPAGTVFTTQNGRIVSLAAVQDLIDALNHIEEVPSFQTLRINPGTAHRVLQSVAVACKGELSEPLILARYFSQHLIRTDDYPDEVVTVETSSGAIRMESTHQHLYGLPWFITGLWSNLDDYNAALSIAIAEISGSEDPNQSRLLNAPFWNEQFENYLPSFVCKP
jgi:hypothetical protein